MQWSGLHHYRPEARFCLIIGSLEKERISNDHPYPYRHFAVAIKNLYTYQGLDHTKERLILIETRLRVETTQQKMIVCMAGGPQKRVFTS